MLLATEEQLTRKRSEYLCAATLASIAKLMVTPGPCQRRAVVEVHIRVALSKLCCSAGNSGAAVREVHL